MKNGPYELIIPPPEYPGRLYRGRYAYEHHVVWWINTGNLVPEGFEIHHKNELKRDNRFENLELMSSSAHKLEHGESRKLDSVKVSCGWCSKDVFVRPNKFRSKLKLNKYGKIFCSQSCGSKHQFNKKSIGTTG